MPDSEVPRLNMRDVLRAISDNFNLDRGLLRTLLDLCRAPRDLVHTYFFCDRRRYTQPPTLLMLMLAAVVLSCRHFLPVSNTYSPNLILKITASTAAELRVLLLLREYDDVLRLILVPATSLISYTLFRRQGWNFAEHLAFNAYVLAFQFFLTAVLLPFCGLAWEWIPGVATIVYFLTTYARVMDGPWPLSLLKAVVILGLSNQIFLIVFYPLTIWLM